MTVLLFFLYKLKNGMKTLNQYLIEANKLLLDPEHQSVVDMCMELQKLYSDDFAISVWPAKKEGKPTVCRITEYYDLKDDHIIVEFSIKYEKGDLLVSTPYITVAGGTEHAVMKGIKYSGSFKDIISNWKPSEFRVTPARDYWKVDVADLDTLKDSVIESQKKLKDIADAIDATIIKDYNDLYAAAEEEASKSIAGCKSVEDFRERYADSGVGRGLVSDEMRVLVSNVLKKDGKFVGAIRKFI